MTIYSSQRCLAALGLSLLLGCATSVERTSLNYSPSKLFTSQAPRLSYLTQLKVTDSRTEKSVLSYKRNLEGGLAAPILSNEPIYLVFQNAFTQELLANEVKVVDTQLANQLLVEIVHLTSYARHGIFSGDTIGDLVMVVIIRSQDGNLLFSRKVAVRGIEPNTHFLSAENVRRALNKALEQGIRSLFSDASFKAAIETGKLL